MILRRLIPDPEAWAISILASDIRRDAITTAIGGEYAGHHSASSIMT